MSKKRDLEPFRKWLRKHISEGSAATYLRAVESALTQFPSDLLKFVLQKHLSYSTRHTYVAALRSWAEYSEDADLQERLASKELKRIFRDSRREEHRSRSRHDVQPFSPDEERRIYATLKKWREDPTLPVWQWPAISMMFALGLRAGADLAGLTHRDVDAALRSGVELVIVTKGNKERAVPAVLVLEELRTLSELSQPWEILADLIVTDRSASGARRVTNAYERLRLCVKKLAEEVSIPQKEMHTHRFRHSAANRLYEVTKDVKKVQEFLGHNDAKTTMGYLKKHRTEEIGNDLLAAMRRNLEE